AGEGLFAMRAELQLHISCPKPILLVDLRPGVGQRDAGAAAEEQFSRGHTAAGGTDDGDALAGDREGRMRTHRSFNVVRLNRAKMMARITKRVITFGSLHPTSSKW